MTAGLSGDGSARTVEAAKIAKHEATSTAREWNWRAYRHVGAGPPGRSAKVMMVRYILQLDETVHASAPSETFPAGKRALSRRWVTVLEGSEVEITTYEIVKPESSQPDIQEGTDKRVSTPTYTSAGLLMLKLTRGLVVTLLDRRDGRIQGAPASAAGTAESVCGSLPSARSPTCMLVWNDHSPTLAGSLTANPQRAFVSLQVIVPCVGAQVPVAHWLAW
jgi:hypothetical protein